MAIEVKPVSGMEQLERWVEIHNQIRPDDPENAAMMALVRAEEREHVDLLAYLDGAPVGTGMLSGDTESQTSGRAWVEVNVLPAYRGHGVGTALLRALSDEARRQGRTGLSCETRADDTYSLRFLERRGFSAHRRWHQFSLELDTVSAAPAPPPEGVQLTTIADRPALLAGMHEVAAATYPELGGHMARHAESFVKWQVYELGSPNVRLDLALLAVADGAVVGFATMRTLLDETTGELRMIAVMPGWRGRGIATALLAAQIAGARRAGIRRLSAWVPSDGPTRLYGKLGFGGLGVFVAFQGPLA